MFWPHCPKEEASQRGQEGAQGDKAGGRVWDLSQRALAAKPDTQVPGTPPCPPLPATGLTLTLRCVGSERRPFSHSSCVSSGARLL